MKNKEQVLIEAIFAYADMGIDPSILTESAGVQTSVLIEASADGASLFSKLNDGRKELMKSVQNIDWKEWVKKMKETISKIIRFITAPARTAVDLATGKTTLKEVGQRLKQVWANLRAKKNKTPEEKTAEKAVGEMANEIAKVEEKIESKSNITVNEDVPQRIIDIRFRIERVGNELRDAVQLAFSQSDNDMYSKIISGYNELFKDTASSGYKALQQYLGHYSGAKSDISDKIGHNNSLVFRNIDNILNRIAYVTYIKSDLNKMIAKAEDECMRLSSDDGSVNEIKGILTDITNVVDLNCQDIIVVYNTIINKLNDIKHSNR